MQRQRIHRRADGKADCSVEEIFIQLCPLRICPQQREGGGNQKQDAANGFGMSKVFKEARHVLRRAFQL
ncbi:MAG: hypothetical protein HDKAJFGB_03580 [Anaerolineae bacterium]|nr:hypothetical protein [Anaerolineae bacterium]